MGEEGRCQFRITQRGTAGRGGGGGGGGGGVDSEILKGGDDGEKEGEPQNFIFNFLFV